MTTSEHLNKIKAKCEQLLELAAKRTPGKWIRISSLATHITCAASENAGNLVCDCPDSSPNQDHFDRDAAFIASCAGPAEAGWRTTIAAIDELEAIHEATPLGEYAAWDALNEIIAAWPEALL